MAALDAAIQRKDLNAGIFSWMAGSRLVKTGHDSKIRANVISL